MTETDGVSNSGVDREPFEEVPFWNQPDLVVDSIRALPERPALGEDVTLTASLSNEGQGAARDVEVVVWVDGHVVGRRLLEEMRAGSSAVVEMTWQPRGGQGLHHACAVASSRQAGRRCAGPRGRADAEIWLGGATPGPARLHVDVPGLALLRFQDGEQVNFSVRVSNPGQTTTEDTQALILVDGQTVAEDRIHPLRSGSHQDVDVRWLARSGDHILSVRLGEMGRSHPGESSPPPGSGDWGISVPGPMTLYSYPAGRDQWASLGPSILSDGNAGRMEDLVFDPLDPRKAYAVSEVGGIWRTTDGGDRWRPVGDRLPTMNFVRVAVDPQNPQIVYAATQNEGVWKSVNGGDSWSLFANPAYNDRVMHGVRALIVRNRDVENQRVIVYVACDAGVLKYASDDPGRLSSTYAEWEQMLADPVWDLAVHPNNPTVLWASVNRWEIDQNGARIQRLDRIAAKAGASAAWTPGQWLPAHGLAKIDVSPSLPSVLYASVQAPTANQELALYRSVDSGSTWRFVCDYPPNNNDYWTTMYNPFVRIDPADSLIVYIAGTRLYRVDVNAALYTTDPHTSVVDGGHPDIKRLVFLPYQPDDSGRQFWVLSDGGIWAAAPAMPALNRNNELRTIQFYDVDAAASDPRLMIGGTQDNETLRYRGNPVWEVIGPEGDGNYSRISTASPSKMYAQGQFLDSTYRTDSGLDKHPSWEHANGSGQQALPSDVWDGYIALDPDNDAHLLAVGDQVRETTDSGHSWHQVGPVADVGQSPVRGSITRVVFRPGTDSQTWLAGTEQGQIWSHTTGQWTGIFEHCGPNGWPDVAAVTGMAFSPCDNKILYVSFAGGSPGQRIYRFEFQGGIWLDQPISGYLPVNVTPRTICGDAHLNTVVYIGTDHGVYRGERTPGLDYAWAPYNDGLPLVKVTSLVVDRTTGELRAGTNGRGAWAVNTQRGWA